MLCAVLNITAVAVIVACCKSHIKRQMTAQMCYFTWLTQSFHWIAELKFAEMYGIRIRVGYIHAKFYITYTVHRTSFAGSCSWFWLVTEWVADKSLERWLSMLNLKALIRNKHVQSPLWSSIWYCKEFTELHCRKTRTHTKN